MSTRHDTIAPTMMPAPAGVSGAEMARTVDPWIAGAAVFLLSLGTVLVYSASAVRAGNGAGDAEAYLARHLSSILMGMVLLAVTLRIPLEVWSKLAYPLLGLSIVLLVAVFVPGLGRRVNGAMRWVSLGPASFQPGELAKLAVVVYLAHSLAKKREKASSFSIGFLPHVVVTSFVVGLVIIQPDIGTSAVIYATLGLMLFVAGTRISYLVLAAWLLRVPTAVLEQNTVPGVTNRVLSRLVRAVYVMFEGSGPYFPRRKVHALGNPIRRQLLANFLKSRIEANGRFNILVLGGSQGAHALNLRMVEAASHLGEVEDAVMIVHQTGLKDVDLVRRAYAEIGAHAEVHAFIDNMSDAYRRADLVVCRAGATTLAEVMVAKKASILIPYPYAADNHQELNARSMVDAGAALMLVERNLDGRHLADAVISLAKDKERLTRMEQAASRAGRPEAAREIVDACFELVERRR